MGETNIKINEKKVSAKTEKNIDGEQIAYDLLNFASQQKMSKNSCVTNLPSE